jgi:hypothetical protein
MCRNRDWTYWQSFQGDTDASADSRETPIPTWLGKTLFIGLGSGIVVVGFVLFWKELLQK